MSGLTGVLEACLHAAEEPQPPLPGLQLPVSVRTFALAWSLAAHLNLELGHSLLGLLHQGGEMDSSALQTYNWETQTWEGTGLNCAISCLWTGANLPCLCDFLCFNTVMYFLVPIVVHKKVLLYFYIINIKMFVGVSFVKSQLFCANR